MALDKLHVGFGVSIVADDRREGKHKQHHRQEIRAPSADMAHNRRLRQLHAAQIGGVVHIRQQQDKRRARTHDDGVDKHAQHLNHALAHRMFHFRRRRRVRRRTLTRFIRIQAALDADHHRLRNHRTEQAAARRFKFEGIVENQAEHMRHRAQISGNHKQRHRHIGHRHNRHHRLSHFRHTLDAAENNRRGQNHQCHADGMFVPAPSRFGGRHNRVGLHRVIHQPETENQAQGKHHTQPALFQALRDVISGAAAEMAVAVVTDFKQLRQRRFGEGRAHADKRRHPHPKHRAGAADCHRNRHTGNIADADAAGQTGHKRLKRRDAVGVAAHCTATQHFFDAAAEQADLYKTGGQSKKQTRTQQQVNQAVPQRAADGVNPLVKLFNHSVSP